MTKEVSLRHLSPQYDAISPDGDSVLTTFLYTAERDVKRHR
jgi:hypothetical protein